jgi:hypothetical protein
MDDKINDLKISKIILEYNFLKTNEELIKEVISTNQDFFLKLISEKLNEIDKENLKEKNEEELIQSKNLEPKLKLNEIDNNTKVKLKKIYRNIVKLTHPDKTTDKELNQLYIEAREAYESYDLFELYFIAKKINLNVKLTISETNILNELIEYKKNEIKALESSFVWAWINARNEEEKEAILLNFLKTHYLK